MMTIKKIKQFGVFVMCALVLGISCSDEFLEVPPAGSLGDAQLGTADGIEALLIGT